MITIAKFKSGLAAYLDEEIVPMIAQDAEIAPWKRWGFSTILTVLVARAEKLLDHPIIKMMDVVKDDKIDIETLYQEGRKNLSTPIPVQIPGMCTLTFTASDLDKLYQHIMS